MNAKIPLLRAGLLSAGLIIGTSAWAVGTAFSYQGQLQDNGTGVTAQCDFQFDVYAADSGGTALASYSSLGVSVNDGLFTTEIDFGAAVFDGSALWLETAVDCGSGVTVLSPRQPILPTPYALHAGSAESMDWAGLTGLSCSDGQVVQWNAGGGAWQCATPLSGDITGVTAGTGLTGGGTSGDVTLSANIGTTADTVAAGNHNHDADYSPLAHTHSATDITSGTLSDSQLSVNVAHVNAAETLSADWVNTANPWADDEVANDLTIDGGSINDTVIKANNETALRFSQSGTAGQTPNVIGGYSGNIMDAAVRGATISGGGAGGYENSVTSHYGTIGGGYANISDNIATIGGGSNNTASGASATIGGGNNNTASGSSATIGGGNNNMANQQDATVAGGNSNVASGAYSVVSGGGSNTASSNSATVSGGGNNTADGSAATIGGGASNAASGTSTSIGGGYDNEAIGDYATISGGGRSNTSDSTTNNVVYDDYGTIGGGGNNKAGRDDGATQDTTNAQYATVGGGGGNTASDDYATVSGGFDNSASIDYSTIGGGYQNSTYQGAYATIGGGYKNSARSSSVVGGGSENAATGGYSTVPGGRYNTAYGTASFAAGYRAKANGEGSFVWADYSNTSSDLINSVANRFMARAAGGVRFYTNSAASTGVYLNSGSGTWGSMSDRNAKENFAAVDSREVLEKVAAMPVETWNYKAQDESIRHMGPMAQDFHAAFGIGEDDRTITTVDADGVALAAIQGLYRLVQEQQAQLQAQQAELRQLRADNEALRTGLQRVESLVRQRGLLQVAGQ